MPPLEDKLFELLGKSKPSVDWSPTIYNPLAHFVRIELEVLLAALALIVAYQLLTGKIKMAGLRPCDTLKLKVVNEDGTESTPVDFAMT